MPHRTPPPCPKCGCPPAGYLELFETVDCARCQRCQEAINIREMALILEDYTDEEIAAEGEEAGRLLCDDDGTEHDFGE